MNIEEKKKLGKNKEELRKKVLENDKKAKVKNIFFYNDFDIINETDKYMGYKEKNVFILEKQGKNGEKIFEIYNKEHKKIAYTNEKGLLNLDNEYKEQLKEQLKDFYPQLGIDEEGREMFLHEHSYVEEGEKENTDFMSKEIGHKVGEKPIDELSKEEKDNEIEKLRENRKDNVDIIDSTLIQEDLGIDAKDLGAMIKIKDKRFYEKVPEAKDFDGDALLVYNNRTNEFMIIGTENGKYVECKGIEPSRGTMKTSIDLDKSGKNVEKQAISGVMKIKGNNDFEFAVNLEPGGSIEFQQLRKTEDGKYISADLRTQGQYQTSWEVDNMMNKKRNRRTRDEKEEFELAQKHGYKSTVQSLRDKEYSRKEKTKYDNIEKNKKEEIEKNKQKEDEDDEWERGHRRDPRWNI